MNFEHTADSMVIIPETKSEFDYATEQHGKYLSVTVASKSNSKKKTIQLLIQLKEGIEYEWDESCVKD